MERELRDILIAHGVYGEENLDEAVEKILLLLDVSNRRELLLHYTNTIMGDTSYHDLENVDLVEKYLKEQ